VAPYSYRWFFPDGSSSTSSNPTYTIGSTGTYGILLTVTDSTGCMDTSYLAVQDTANINPCTAFVYDSLFSNGTLHWYYASGFFSSSATLNWDFGDNTFATGNSVSHNYTSNGRYTVTLTVIDSLHNCSFVVTTTSVVTGAAGGSGCQASISSLCNAPGVYTFNAVGNFAPPSTAALTWSFGDGTSGMGQSVTHAYYNISGYVTICLSIYDSMAQCQNTVCDTILISGRSSPCSTRIGSTHIDTTFSLYTINTGVAPFTYVWRLPTGTYNVYTSSSFPSPVISLPIPTPYTAYPVWVYVTDSVGCVDSAWAYIYPDSTLLSPNACQAFFVMIEDTTTAGDYYAVDLSIGSGGSLTYTWSFGDGTSATGQYPTHTYSTPGYYTVCLNIMDSLNSCNSTFCDSTFYAHKRLGGPMSSFSVRPRGAAGVADIKQTTDLFTIYPNPATSVVEFRINSSDKIIKSAIFSVSGKKVAETGSATQVSVSNLALGMYFVEIITNTGTYRSSFVKHD
jgi:PKD repeat protein